MHQKQTSVSRVIGQKRNPYIIAAAISIAALAFAAFPIAVDAFWPFFVSRAATQDVPTLHDADMELLDAATNPDPNPSKGGLAIATSEDLALLPSGGPIGDLSSAAVGSPAPDITLYEVREGDSLSEIADMFGVSVATIRSANGLEGSTIQPGQTLKILPYSGVVYKIKRGGTLSDVAKLFDVEVSELVEANGVAAGESLAVGTEIIVPGGTELSKPKSSSATGVAVVKKTLPALTGYFGNPLPGGRITQGIHGRNGIDVGSPAGTPVYAAAAGTVTVAESDGLYNGGYGNYVDVVHDNGTKTRYAHLSSVSVSVGQTVEKGQKLGGVGRTGKSTGNHLHFEVHGAKNPLAH